MPPVPDDRRLSALPSVRARWLAFVAILVAGIAGGLIGSSFVHLTCDGNCGTAQGIGAVGGAMFAAGGVAVVSVLVLRAMGEWRRVQSEQDP
ncbi:MAG: hypothetical protein QOG87_3813 [Actinomycetota bacterium]|jgi:hypothetical protein